MKFGTVGPILPGFEVKTAEDGEILIRSQTVFAGYYNDEEATRAAIDADGWLHSGDIGEIDEDGFLRITDRKKDIIVTAGGKNLAPQTLENALKSSNLVSQALVVGDRRPYVVALVALDEDEADGVPPRTHAPPCSAPWTTSTATAHASSRSSASRSSPRDFSAEEGEVTPTMKLKRRVVEQHFADEIERLYAAR